LAAEAGVVFPDHLIFQVGPTRPRLEQVIGNLRAGVTELFIHPAVDTPELRAFAPDWASRVDDHALVTEGALRDRLDAMGVQLIGYEPLRDLQRAGALTS
jgi:hypothetical protein